MGVRMAPHMSKTTKRKLNNKRKRRKKIKGRTHKQPEVLERSYYLVVRLIAHVGPLNRT
jgi:hypothetical protein